MINALDMRPLIWELFSALAFGIEMCAADCRTSLQFNTANVLVTSMVLHYHILNFVCVEWEGGHNSQFTYQSIDMWYARHVCLYVVVASNIAAIFFISPYSRGFCLYFVKRKKKKFRC